MKLRENIRIAVHNLKTSRLRSVLTMLTVAAGICCMLLTVGIGQGSRSYIKEEFAGVGVNTLLLTVSPENSTQADYITFEDIRLLKANIPSVTYATPVFRLEGEGKSDPFVPGMPLKILAGNTDLAYVMDYHVSHGRFFTEDEFEYAQRVAVLDKSAAKEIFGFENVVGQSLDVLVASKRIRLTIVGVTEENDASVLSYNAGKYLSIPATTVLNLIGGEERTNSCYLVAENASVMQQTADDAEQYLSVRHNNQVKNLYRANHVAQYTDMMNRVQSVFASFGAVVAVAAVLLGGIGIMSMMLLSVHQRAREIGIRKALGARTRTILIQFLAEAVILSLIGSGAGIVLGVGLSWVIGSLIGIAPVFHIKSFLFLLAFACLTGIAFGILPAKKAAELPPRDALRRD